MQLISKIPSSKTTKILIYKDLNTKYFKLKIKGKISSTFLFLPKNFKIGFNLKKQKNDLISNKELILFYSEYLKKNKQKYKFYNLLFIITRFLLKEFNLVNQLSVKNLHIFGFGYRAYLNKTGTILALKLGYSHKVYVKLKKFQKIKKINRYNISILGSFKDLLNQTCSDIRKFKTPDIYKGKGVRFLGEEFKFKVGKKSQDR